MKKIPHLEYRTYGGKYQVVQDWEYKRNIHGTFERLFIPSEYTTNGASIPRVFCGYFPHLTHATWKKQRFTIICATKGNTRELTYGLSSC